MPIIGGGGSGGGGGASAPGYEIGYTQITAPVNIVSTTEATGTTIVSAGALTFDGSPVICEFFCDRIIMPQESISTTSVNMTISLFESATQITRLAFVSFQVNQGANNALQVPICARYRFTPTAAAHTYTVTAAVSATTNTPSVQAGSGGTGGEAPAYIRFTKV